MGTGEPRTAWGAWSSSTGWVCKRCGTWVYGDHHDCPTQWSCADCAQRKASLDVLVQKMSEMEAKIHDLLAMLNDGAVK